MRLAPLLVLGALALAGCAGLAPPRSDAAVEVLSWSFVRDGDGARVVGEIVNRGPSHAEKLRVIATFVDVNGTLLARATAPAWRALLEADERSAFDLEAPAGAANATLVAEGETSRRVPFEKQRLAPRNVGVQQAVGSPHVTFKGLAVNEGDLPVTGLEAQVTFRSADGAVVGVARVAPEAAVLRAGESSPFEGGTRLAGDFLRFDVVVVTLARPR